MLSPLSLPTFRIVFRFTTTSTNTFPTTPDETETAMSGDGAVTATTIGDGTATGIVIGTVTDADAMTGTATVTGEVTGTRSTEAPTLTRRRPKRTATTVTAAACHPRIKICTFSNVQRL